MLPLLRQLSDGQQKSFVKLLDDLTNDLQLTPNDVAETLESGQSRFENRVGSKVLAEKPARIDAQFLMQYPPFAEFRTNARQDEATGAPASGQSAMTPLEQIEAGARAAREALEGEVLARVRDCSDGFFEQLVIDLLVKMGYGGSRRDAGTRVGRSGDGGIDGIINEDILGLGTIYIQAKRWNSNSVGRPDMQQFVGALQGKHATNGVFITVGSFNENATRYVHEIGVRVVLIDGTRLAKLMVEHGVGVTTSNSVELKRLDSDYFLED